MTIKQEIIKQVVNAKSHHANSAEWVLDEKGIEKAIDELANKSKEEVDKEIGDAVELIFNNL